MAMGEIERVLDELIERTGGILALQPTFVRRFYMDGGRLGLGKKPGDTYQPDSKLWIPERWIASTVEAVNPHPISGEGLSCIMTRKAKLTLKDALKMRGDLLLGEERNKAHNGDFLVLVKILDPYEPIVFHFHASDRAVASFPQYFAGHRFGKDEAYYFLDAPKGNVPYTHVGLHKGVGVEELKRAIESGRDYILELSPHFYQRYGEGFFVPAGVPHRPGTALTLEVQQPSDVYTLLETKSNGRRMSAEQVHPGFPDIDTALQFIEMDVAQQDDIIERYRLIPIPVEGKEKGGEERWIVPPTLTNKFSAKQLTVHARFESVESSPYALFIWRGRGRLNGKAVRGGNEFFVSHMAASKPHIFESEGGEPLVAFKFFPADLSVRPLR
ncbi:MAG: hypothetical protein N2381_06840 [Armatimonadetes bacterium]|nr:hypothetical protein [Armatimonadota bacterium]